MRKLIHVFSILLILLAALLTLDNKVLMISAYGVLGFSYILFILFIPFLARKVGGVFKQLLAERMWLGIYSFIFILIHFLLAANEFFGFDLFSIIQAQPLAFIAFWILFGMAVTSNRFSMKLLGKNWKKLHNLVYVAIILGFIHAINSGVIFFSNQIIALVFGLLVLIALGLKIKYSFLKNKKN